MVPPYQYAGAPACRAAFVGSIQPTKIPLTFFQKFDKAAGLDFVRRFSWHFYGADRGNYAVDVANQGFAAGSLASASPAKRLRRGVAAGVPPPKT